MGAEPLGTRRLRNNVNANSVARRMRVARRRERRSAATATTTTTTLLCFGARTATTRDNCASCGRAALSSCEQSSDAAQAQVKVCDARKTIESQSGFVVVVVVVRACVRACAREPTDCSATRDVSERATQRGRLSREGRGPEVGPPPQLAPMQLPRPQPIGGARERVRRKWEAS